MFYEAELRMLRDTFRKCRIQTNIADLTKPISEQPESTLHVFIADRIDRESPLSDFISHIHPATIYRMRDPFDCRYLYLQLPEFPTNAILLIGPYMPAAPSKEVIMEWAEKNNVPPSQLLLLESYYNSVPILPETSHLFAMIDAFAERIWGAGNLPAEDINQDVTPIVPIQNLRVSMDDEASLLQMQHMELLYRYENELMDAVSKGQIHKADVLFSNFSTFNFEQRTADPVRNVKNYAIIMNTLLRKAAEQGGVHPMYIHSVSSALAMRIEKTHTIDEFPKLITDMFREYCRLVRQHSIKNYSPPVQKALLHIDGNLAENLTLRSLADTLNVSSSYLSSLFRKETGYTLTDYICRRRVRHAMHLLKTTRLQVQTVAQHCGMMDVQYFSKIFKKIAGMTPREYRLSQTGGG